MPAHHTALRSLLVDNRLVMTSLCSQIAQANMVYYQTGTLDGQNVCAQGSQAPPDGNYSSIVTGFKSSSGVREAGWTQIYPCYDGVDGTAYTGAAQPFGITITKQAGASLWPTGTAGSDFAAQIKSLLG